MKSLQQCNGPLTTGLDDLQLELARVQSAVKYSNHMWRTHRHEHIPQLQASSCTLCWVLIWSICQRISEEKTPGFFLHSLHPCFVHGETDRFDTQQHKSGLWNWLNGTCYYQSIFPYGLWPKTSISLLHSQCCCCSFFNQQWKINPGLI